MKEKPQTCPICFTKMRSENHGLICPECGYRYCDHNYDGRDPYSTNHVHTPHYTTTAQTSSSKPVYSNTQYTRNTQSSQRSTQTSADATAAAKKVKKIVLIIFLVYFFIIFLSGFLPGILALIFDLL